jgi:hypothetical protein
VVERFSVLAQVDRAHVRWLEKEGSSLMITRRTLFSLFPALGALAVPVVAKADDPEPAIQPIILEHTCDGGKSRYTSEEIREIESYGPRQWGCGTTFRWHFGVNPYCPNCGWAYEWTIPLLKRGVYHVVQGRIPAE